LFRFGADLRLEDLHHVIARPRFPAHVSQLQNGLTVIHQHLAVMPVVTVDVWVRAGAIAEPESWAGMAHFLEHMIFKGTHQLPPGSFDYLVESRGGVTNAATSHDYAHYFVNTSSLHLSDTLPALAELLMNAAIPDDEFERERHVVLEEIRQAYDDPDWIGFQSLMANVYHYHPYGRSVLGDEERLMRRSPQEMRQFHRALYQPENMTVVVVGDVSQDRAIALVEDSFNQFATPASWKPPTLQPEPLMEEVRREELGIPRLELARLMMAWVGPGADHLRDAYGLDLLSVVLAGSQSSRLVQELREERQLVQDVTSSFSLQRDSSLFTVSAWLEVDQLERVEAIIGDRIAQLGTHPIPDAELNRHKRLLCNDYAFSTETTCQLSGLYGYYSTVSRPEHSVTYPDHIQSFSAEELQALASQYLSAFRYAVTVMKPS
jgi:predicted Zn-dependent peptidase